VNFVKNVDFEPGPAWSDSRILSKLADFFDTAIASGINFQNVDIIAGTDTFATIALPAWFCCGTFDAIQGFGVYSGGGGFSDSPRTGEKIGVSDAL
jgi:hypothetical protein